MAQYLDKAGLTTLWTKIKTTFALKKHTHKKSEITDLTIPTVNNPTITINQGGVKKGSFSLNQSGAATIDLTDDNTTYSTATQSADGLMSAADKKKLEGIAEGANKITVDSALSSTSTNPVQNKVIKSALDGKAGLTHEHSISNITGLQTALNGKQEKGDYYTINGVQARDDEFVIGDGNGGLVASGYTTSSFASSNHDHDSRYYTESEIDDKLGKKANISHSHSSLTNSSGRVFNVPIGGSGGEQKTLVITDDLNAYQPAGNYASASHNHAISDITGLYDELTGMTYVADSSNNSVQLETYGDGNSFSIPTKGYVDNALNGKSNLDHNHDSVYQAKGDYATNDTLKSYVTGTTFIDYTTYIEGEVNKKANVSHDHGISDINGLQSALDGKSSVGHTHSEYVTGTDFSAYTSWIEGEVNGKSDIGHTHSISNVSGLQSALDGKSGTGHTHSYLPISGGTLTGAFGFNSNYLIKPVAEFRTTDNIYTGAITIALPADISNTMVSMWIDVYNYSTNTSFSVHVGGYTYNNNTWQHNPFAMVYGANHTVRLGHNGTNFVIYIGETNSTWSYPQISVRDVILGYTPVYDKWKQNWGISFVTSFSNVSAVINNYAWTTKNFTPPTSLPANGGNADTVDGKHSSDFYLSGSNITNLPINGGIYWNPYVESSSDGSDAASITVIKDGNGTGGTVLQIKQANDANDIVNVVAGDLRVNGTSVSLSGHNHDGKYLQYNGWWNSNDSHNVDDASGMVFSYNSHGAPVGWGTTVTFECELNSSYRLQLHGEGYNNTLHFRNRSSDRGGWLGWNEIIHSGNIGSQNVNYANSAGSANSVAWGNVSGRPSSLPASNISMSSDGTTLTITYS